jgi:hypothetical protein
VTPEPSTKPPEAAARTTDSVDPSERESSTPDVPDFAHDQLHRGRETGRRPITGGGQWNNAATSKLPCSAPLSQVRSRWLHWPL